MIRYDRRSIALAVALSTLAGYVDATGYLSTGGFFVSFMSGNSTRLGIGLGEGQWPYAFLASGVVALFVGGVVLGSLVAHRADERRKPAVLGLVALFLAFAALAFAAAPRLGTAAVLLAMGAENATFQREGEVSIGLTYMTGTLVKLGQRLAAALHGGPRWAFVPYAALWLGLVSGAVLGALVHARSGQGGLWLAAAVALALAVLAKGVRPPLR